MFNGKHRRIPALVPQAHTTTTNHCITSSKHQCPHHANQPRIEKKNNSDQKNARRFLANSGGRIGIGREAYSSKTRICLALEACKILARNRWFPLCFFPTLLPGCGSAVPNMKVNCSVWKTTRDGFPIPRRRPAKNSEDEMATLFSFDISTEP